MKSSRLFTIVLVLMLVGLTQSCEDKKKVDYLNLEWIWVGEDEIRNDGSGSYRFAFCLYRSTIPPDPQSFLQDVDSIYDVKSQAKWIHYYEDDGYIDYERVGEDEIRSEDVGDLVEYEIK